MDKDRIRGSAQQAKGAVKEVVVASWKTVFLGVFAGAKYSGDRHGSG
jgi:hypothetical protein